jgi:hypothetical protein
MAVEIKKRPKYKRANKICSKSTILKSVRYMVAAASGQKEGRDRIGALRRKQIKHV